MSDDGCPAGSTGMHSKWFLQRCCRIGARQARVIILCNADLLLTRRSGLGEEEIAAAIEERAAARAAKDYAASDAVGGATPALLAATCQGCWDRTRRTFPQSIKCGM